MHLRVAIEYKQGDADRAALAAAAEAVRKGLALLAPKPGAKKGAKGSEADGEPTPPEFDGKALAGLQLDINELHRLMGEYVIKLVAVDNGLGVSQFTVGDTIQTLDKGARDSSGRIVDFNVDGTVAKFRKSNGTIGEVATDYIKHF